MSWKIQILPGKHLGDLVVEAQHVFKGYNDRLLIEDLTFRLPPGGIVGVIGANGVGKTTLFRMIMGLEKPDQGVFASATPSNSATFDQSRDSLNPASTVFEEISGGHDTLDMGGRKLNARSYVARFNFQGTDQQKLVGNLSGGERNRVHLAKLLRQGTNVLLLDEPTNDLDVDTLRALEEAIVNFAGCAVVISHDRWFLDRVATHILAFEGTAMSTGAKAISRPTNSSAGSGKESRPISPTASGTKSCSTDRLRSPTAASPPHRSRGAVAPCR